MAPIAAPVRRYKVSDIRRLLEIKIQNSRPSAEIEFFSKSFF
jgi:hypothetical protein